MDAHGKEARASRDSKVGMKPALLSRNGSKEIVKLLKSVEKKCDNDLTPLAMEYRIDKECRLVAHGRMPQSSSDSLPS